MTSHPRKTGTEGPLQMQPFRKSQQRGTSRSSYICITINNENYVMHLAQHRRAIIAENNNNVKNNVVTIKAGALGCTCLLIGRRHHGCVTGKLGNDASSLSQCPLPPLLVGVPGLKGHLVSYSHVHGGPVGTLSAIQILSFL